MLYHISIYKSSNLESKIFIILFLSTLDLFCYRKFSSAVISCDLLTGHNFNNCLKSPSTIGPILRKLHQCPRKLLQVQIQARTGWNPSNKIECAIYRPYRVSWLFSRVKTDFISRTIENLHVRTR